MSILASFVTHLTPVTATLLERLKTETMASWTAAPNRGRLFSLLANSSHGEYLILSFARMVQGTAALGDLPSIILYEIFYIACTGTVKLKFKL